MSLMSSACDEFGPIMFNVNNIVESIPRSHSSEYKHIEVKSLILNNISNDTYLAYPNTNIQAINEKKADKIIRKHIWNNFFGLSGNYAYSEIVHYPTTFAIYLKTRLNIELSSLGNITLSESPVNTFTLLIRNVIFTKILYLFKPHFIEVTNTLVKGRPITIYNSPMFEIKKQWKHWLQ